MKKFTFLFALFSFYIVFAAFSQKGLVNPAAKYCEMLGYRYEIVSSKNMGDQGMVHLPDGRIVNAWDFFKGKVAQEYSYPARHGYEVETRTIEQDGFIIEEAVCVIYEKGEVVRISLEEFMEINGDQLMDDENRSLEDVHTNANYDPDFIPSKDLPASFDWRNYNGNAYIGTPRDQGGCGSCYAFGATAAAEGTYNFAMGKYGSNVADFSESYIAWCLGAMSAYNSHFYGCNGADYDYMELQALCDIGTIDESYFPYSDANNQSCPSAATNAPKTKFASWHRVNCNDIAAIKTAIMTYGVVDAAVYVTTSFQNYSGGIFTDSYTTCSSNPCYNTPTNHAISLVGWGYDATYGDYWILRNSWGNSWGEGGYMRIKATSARVGCSVCYMVYENDGTTAPTVTTNTVTSIGDNSAVSGGNITSNGGATVTASGLVYAKTASPTLTTGTVVSTSPVVTSGSYSLTMSGLTSGTTYYVRAYATNSKGTSYGTERTFTTTGDAPIEYCTSKGNNYSYEWIASVTVGSLTNASGAAGYTDFTNKTVTLNPGTAYNVSLTPGFASTTYNEYWKIWIDLNGDGDFDDTGELVFDPGSMSKTTVTGTLTIPSGTASKTTRMRVSMKYNAAQTSCETFSYGEVEDYTVVIQSTGDTQAPTAPTNLAASSITQTTLTLTWTASTDNVGVTGYDIYSNGSLLGSVTGTSANVTGLTASTTYSFYVKAKDAAGNISAASNTISVTTLAPPDTQAPTAPTNLAASNVTQTTLMLSWTASTDNVAVTGYQVYRGGTLIGTTASTSYNVSGLTAATTYSFYVKAYDAAGNVSNASNTISVTTPDQTITYCTSKGNNYSYEWIASVTVGSFTNSSGAAGYTDFTSKVINLQAGQAYNISLTPGFASTTYNEYWKIWVDLNGDGDFDDSGELVFDAGTMSKTTVTGTLTIPAGTAAISSRMRVSMKYNGAQTSCETFSYGEVEDYTVNITQATPDTQAPTAPTNLAASNITQTTLTLSWTASTDNVGVVGYQVYQGSTMLGTVTSTSCSISNLTPATTYSFYVKAYDAAGNVSAASNTISVTTLSNTVTYCSSKGNNVTYEWIDLVKLGEINNVTAANGGYGDFTSMVATLGRGTSNTIYFSAGFRSTAYTEYWYIWIDWNQNGVFESTELINASSSKLATTLSKTFTVPTTAALGTTRMRVTMKYNAAPTACETFSYGEVEDYTINVVNNSAPNPKQFDNSVEDDNEPPTTLSVYPNPVSELLSVRLNADLEYGIVSIYNNIGVLVKRIEIYNNENQINVSDLAAGIYMIRLDDLKEPFIARFVKE
jgi:chitodextrinase/C1A family cysteine protease